MLCCGLDALHASCRATTLKTALLEQLLPQLGGELRAKLLSDAQQVVLLQVSDKLWEYASEAPTQVNSDAALIGCAAGQQYLAGCCPQPASAIRSER